MVLLAAGPADLVEADLVGPGWSANELLLAFQGAGPGPARGRAAPQCL